MFFVKFFIMSHKKDLLKIVNKLIFEIFRREFRGQTSISVCLHKIPLDDSFRLF